MVSCPWAAPPLPRASPEGGTKGQNHTPQNARTSYDLTRSSRAQAVGLAMTPLSVVLDSTAAAITNLATAPLDSEGRTGTFKIRVARGQNRDLGQPEGSERDGDAALAQFCQPVAMPMVEYRTDTFFPPTCCTIIRVEAQWHSSSLKTRVVSRSPSRREQVAAHAVATAPAAAARSRLGQEAPQAR